MTDNALELRSNAGQLTAMFGAVAGDLANMSGPLAGVIALVVAAAEAGSPRRSGRMVGAHTGRVTGKARARVTVDTPYAAPVHWGWPSHGIKRQPWVVATFNRNTAWMDRMERDTQTNLDRRAGAVTGHAL